MDEFEIMCRNWRNNKFRLKLIMALHSHFMNKIPTPLTFSNQLIKQKKYNNKGEFVLYCHGTTPFNLQG